jgi:hypothetical protein
LRRRRRSSAVVPQFVEQFENESSIVGGYIKKLQRRAKGQSTAASEFDRFCFSRLMDWAILFSRFFEFVLAIATLITLRTGSANANLGLKEARKGHTHGLCSLQEKRDALPFCVPLDLKGIFKIFIDKRLGHRGEIVLNDFGVFLI